MAKTTTPEVYLQLPDGAARDALRAGLLALQCIPVNLPASGPALAQQVARLAGEPHAVVFLDIANPLLSVHHPFGRIVSEWPPALRGRTILSRLAAGHVSQADRAWVQALGFADLVAEFDGAAPQTGLRPALDHAAAALGLARLPDAELGRYVQAMADAPAQVSARALIRARTGLGAEALADLLHQHLDIVERSYYLKKYPACFIGTQAVSWLAKRFALTPETAVKVGRALESLGLLHHVESQHAFSNEAYFFRLRAPGQLAGLDLGLALQTLRRELLVEDRSYLGKVYRHCWVGSDAVEALCRQHAIARHEGQLTLSRLMQFGLFEHVVNEHAFVDGNFFYRFTEPAL